MTDRRQCSRPIYKVDNTNKALSRKRGAGIRLGIQRIPGTMRILSQILVQHVRRPRLCEYLVKILEFGAMYQGQKSVEQYPFREDWSVDN
ncbi:hypothetical protein WJX82_003330 [Trebouxia sp. C0006]